MTIRIISAEHESAGTIRCAHCWDLRATHIEVSHTHDHTPDEHLIVCAECARLAGLLTCSGCVDEKLWVHSGAAFGELTPVYAPSELIDNCCAKHARLCLQPAMTKGVSSPEIRAS
ncbi:hypothetical protein ACNFBT_17275 [Pseudomonas sp. NY15181]|uniref:hypothetical protein n=1 Tax=Pseudomonas sp. NY15181 TaxID=3400349 RepID=UPI003A89F64F